VRRSAENPWIQRSPISKPVEYRIAKSGYRKPDVVGDVSLRMLKPKLGSHWTPWWAARIFAGRDRPRECFRVPFLEKLRSRLMDALFCHSGNDDAGAICKEVSLQDLEIADAVVIQIEDDAVGANLLMGWGEYNFGLG
jgi:hypothetical protein